MKKILSLFIVILFFNTTAWAGAVGKPFDEKQFKKLQAEDAVVLIDVYAPWCSTCAKQQKILAEYQKKNPDANLHIFVVNFDKDKKWVREFRAPRQSTMILYKGEQKKWFSVAETRPEVIFSALDKVVKKQ